MGRGGGGGTADARCTAGHVAQRGWWHTRGEREVHVHVRPRGFGATGVAMCQTRGLIESDGRPGRCVDGADWLRGGFCFVRPPSPREKKKQDVAQPTT